MYRSKISTQLSVTSWNVNGLIKRLNGHRHYKFDDPAFRQLIVSDIVFLCETHLCYNENVTIEGYKYWANCRSIEPSRVRGGLGVFIKQSLVKGIEIVDKTCTEYIWLKLSRYFFGFPNDIYICFVYIPPVNSSYTIRTGIDKTIFTNLEENINKFSNKGEIVLMGDMNAHISRKDYDYIKMDSNDLLIDDLPSTYKVDNIMKDRNIIKEQSTNVYGKQILDLCISAELRILNGRILGDTMGRLTSYNFRGTAVDDYCICSASLLNSVLSFEVDEYCPLLSDHCPITLTLHSYMVNLPDTQLKTFNPPKWSRDIEEKFAKNIEIANFDNIQNLLQQVPSESTQADKTNKLNKAITSFNNILTLSASKHNRKTRRTNPKRKNKPWFDKECQSKLRLIRKLCRDLKKQPWDNSMRLSILVERKKLNKMIRKNHRRHKKQIYDKLLNTEEKDPSLFWNLIDTLQEKSREETFLNITSSEWTKHFEQLMNKTQNNNYRNENQNIQHKANYDTEILNSVVTSEEVFEALKQMKRKKSGGPDKILSEMIFVSCNINVNIYVDIFNTILQNGIYPEAWKENFITPIFKGGCANDPFNYRGIALTSSLAKLFARILHNRLQTFLKANNILVAEQIGFRKKSRTADHVFTLKTIIDKMFKKKQYLYSCFIDFRKAFDIVNRKALLFKLKEYYGIEGLYFNIIENMYEDVRFSVKLKNRIAPVFKTSIGVKQGCVLSPTFFSLYINDLVEIFDDSCFPIKLQSGTKISCLLYADDLIIMSEKACGLQEALKKLNTYCQKWNLEINVEKTKIMIFNKSGKLMKKHKFTINNTQIDITDSYKYLGTIFKPSGTFTAAVKHLTNKAKKAIFSIRNIFPQNRLSLIQNLKIFDACIKPILMYNSEVWGPEIIFHDKKRIEKNYMTNFLPENIHIRFIKHTLGVSKYAVNMAVLAETGRFPIALFAIKSIIRFWYHIIETPNTSLVKKSYTDGLQLNTTLIKKIEKLFDTAGFTHVWENQNTFSIKRLENAIVEKFKERYLHFWKESCDPNSNEYNRKLRTYNKFKQNYKLENYLLLGIDKKEIITFIKLRISDSKLMIEKGRHENLPIDKRLCPLCKENVEDEYHFTTQCKMLSNARTILINKITDIIPNFMELNDIEKLKFLLAPKDTDISKICVTEINKMYEIRFNLLETNQNC